MIVPRVFTNRLPLPSVVLLLALMGPGVAPLRAQEVGPSDPFPAGRGLITADFDGTPLNLHSYKPSTFAGEGFILLLHGASRTAARYRDDSAGMAEAFGRLVVVPEFDLERFPNRTYQMGGVFREDGSVAAPEERTYAFVPKLAQLPTGDAYDQGVHRYSRNLRWFNEAMDLAYLREWEFNWRLVIADGPGHSPRDVFDHPQTENALFGHRR